MKTILKTILPYALNKDMHIHIASNQNCHTQYYMVSIWLKVETNLQTHINWNEILGLCFWIKTYEANFKLKNCTVRKRLRVLIDT
jgi:hypothetical protein